MPLKKIQIYVFITLLPILALLLPSAPAQTPGSSPSSPMPVGSTLDAIIECGEGYTSHELYDAGITILEIIRGEEAWKRLQETDESNSPADDGLEYILARVRFEYRARGLPGTCIHPLSPEHFTAYSSAGEGYGKVDVVTPKPELRKRLESGKTFEGWLVFKVAEQDKAPLVYYSIDEGGGTQHGGGKWFVLK